MVEYAVALALLVAVIGGAFAVIERNALETQRVDDPLAINGRGPCGELIPDSECI